MKSLGELLIKINFIPDDKKREAVLPTLQLFQRGLLELPISPAPVQAEGLQFMYQLCSEERATFIKETLHIDLEKLLIQDYVGLLWRYAEIFNELEGIRVGLLEGICHETFDDFLPESLKSTQPPKLPPVNDQATQPQKETKGFTLISVWLWSKTLWIGHHSGKHFAHLFLSGRQTIMIVLR